MDKDSREKVLHMVTDEMDGTRGPLEKELKGIPLMVMQAIMEVEEHGICSATISRRVTEATAKRVKELMSRRL